MLAQTSHIQWNNLILSESLRNSFFFSYNLKLSAYLKRKQSYDVLTWPLKNVLFIFAENKHILLKSGTTTWMMTVISVMY